MHFTPTIATLILSFVASQSTALPLSKRAGMSRELGDIDLKDFGQALRVNLTVDRRLAPIEFENGTVPVRRPNEGELPVPLLPKKRLVPAEAGTEGEDLKNWWDNLRRRADTIEAGTEGEGLKNLLDNLLKRESSDLAPFHGILGLGPELPPNVTGLNLTGLGLQLRDSDSSIGEAYLHHLGPGPARLNLTQSEHLSPSAEKRLSLPLEGAPGPIISGTLTYPNGTTVTTHFIRDVGSSERA